MSADNGIYILESPDRINEGIREYRVCHAQAIENIYWNEYLKSYTSEVNLDLVWYLWKDSLVYLNREEAVLKAYDISRDYDLLEYGIQVIKIDVPFPVESELHQTI